MFILSTVSDQRLTITKDQKDKIISIIESGAKYVTVNGSYLNVSSIMSIVPAEDHISARNEKLNSHGQWMCRSMKTHAAGEPCNCTRESRVAKGERMITSQRKIECPQCKQLCTINSENPYCDGCDASLVLQSPEQRAQAIESANAKFFGEPDQEVTPMVKLSAIIQK